MRIFLVFPVLPLLVGLVAWGQHDVETTLRVVIVESLEEELAGEVLPIFETELNARLAVDRRRARFMRVRVGPGSGPMLPDAERLQSADLVVSFGGAAAERGSLALDGTTTPHLFAYLPRDLAHALTDRAAAARGAPATGITGQLPRGAAFAIATRLLASREAPPLRIGILHPAGSEATSHTMQLLVELPGFVAVPISLPDAADTDELVRRVGAAARAAAASEMAVDAFWLALDASAPLDLLVRAIVRRTGRPIVYASSERAVAAGALMALAPEPTSTAREAAVMASRLLDGAVQADLPVRPPHRVDFSLNLRTAEALGLVPGHELLELARGRLYW